MEFLVEDITKDLAQVASVMVYWSLTQDDATIK